MNRLYLLAILFFSSLGLSAQSSLNMTLLGTWDGSTSSCLASNTVCYNEVWGYEDELGNEYAIIGSPYQLHFIDVTNPSNPTLVQSLTGTGGSIWRDMKTYGDYLYCVHDSNVTSNSEGLWIIDMSDIENGNVSSVKTVESQFGRAHNIFIDEPNARLYVAGANSGRDITVYGLADPENPSLLANLTFPGSGVGHYIHDLYVRDNIAYLFQGNSGMFVYDFTTANNPVLLDNTGYTGGYNHSGWMTDDGNYLVFADETVGRPLSIVNVSDVPNSGIGPATEFKQALLAPNNNNIAHNPLIKGNFAYVSYYEDGVQVWDLSNPASPSLSAYYDNSNNTTYSGTEQVWGVYPFLSSGNILMSDDRTGLYVLRPDFNLPVEMSYFTAKANRFNQVDLNWATITEVNSRDFEVERSLDGETFVSIGTVGAAGNSETEIRYSFTDERPEFGTSYYRLRKNDIDGSYSYSDVATVTLKKERRITVFPNPISSDKKVHLNWEAEEYGDVTVNIYDLNGKTVMSGNYQSSLGSLIIDVEMLSQGNYILEFADSQGVHTEKLMVSGN